MTQNPVMYALAYKYEEDVWANFEKDETDDNLSFHSLLPSKQLAEDMILEVWGTDYVIVPVEVMSYRDGVTNFVYDIPASWE